MRTSKQLLIIAPSFVLGMFLYFFAVLSTFGFEFSSAGFSPFEIVVVSCIGGVAAVVLGYASVVVLGGMISMKLNEFIARATRCKQVIELIDENPGTSHRRIVWQDFLVCVPALVFILSVMTAWDIHNLHDPQTSFFHPLLHALDIFSNPTTLSPQLHSVDVIPANLVLIAIAGIAPSIAIPYFRKFRITGVNSGPFHTNFLFLVVGLIVGLGTLLTLLGFIYRVLWVGKGPIYYHYVLLAMLGFSLHYTLGTFLGRNKSEDMVMNRVRAIQSERVIRGTITIRGSPAGDEQTPQ